MLTRKQMYQVGALAVIVVGVVLIGVGTAGAATPLIAAGVICLLAGGGFGMVASLDVRR